MGASVSKFYIDVCSHFFKYSHIWGWWLLALESDFSFVWKYRLPYFLDYKTLFPWKMVYKILLYFIIQWWIKYFFLYTCLLVIKVMVHLMVGKMWKIWCWMTISMTETGSDPTCLQFFQSNEPPETITVSSFAQKFRPRNMAPYMTPPRYSADPSSPKLNNDPLLAGSPVIKTKSIPSDGTVGGFPVKFLDMVVCRELAPDSDKLKDIYALCVCVCVCVCESHSMLYQDSLGQIFLSMCDGNNILQTCCDSIGRDILPFSVR
jgi:hypothetical protein